MKIQQELTELKDAQEELNKESDMSKAVYEVWRRLTHGCHYFWNCEGSTS